MDKEAIALLEELVTCRSLTPAADGALDIVATRLQAAGFTVQLSSVGEVSNLWATIGERPRLVFVGHVDVVPPGDDALWYSEPFTPMIKDGVLYGRGAADMKSGVAAMVIAAVRAAKDGVAVFLTSDEEGAAENGAKYFVAEWQKSGRAPIAYGIVGEPTCEQHFGDSIKIGRRGSLTGHLQISGDQLHIAYAHRGSNAIHRLVGILQKMEEKWRGGIAAQERGEMATTLQIASIKGGIGANNVTPPSASAVFNFRYAASDTQADLRSSTEKIAAEVAGDDWRCDWQCGAEPFLMSEAGELVSALHNSIEEITGVTARLTTSGGTSDGRFFRHICGELAEFGVCNSTIHAPNECVDLRDVSALADIYARLIERLL